MSERIRVSGSWSDTQNWQSQEHDWNDIRYTGIIPKQRYHPRLLIRRFRTDADLPSSISTVALELDNFILETVDEHVEEKYQIVQTFGPDFIFFYGTKPRIFHYSGRLFNTLEKPWKNDWQRAWDRQVPYSDSTLEPPDNNLGSDSQRAILSGSNVVLNGGIARLEYDGSIAASIAPAIGASNLGYSFSNELARSQSVIVREGYLLNLHINFAANPPNTANFKFSMFITNTMEY